MSELRKDRTNRKTIQNKQPKTESRVTDTVRAGAGEREHFHLGQLRQSIGDLGALRASFQKSPATTTTTTTRPRDPKFHFAVRYSVSFDLISSFSLSFLGTGPGRGGGKVLFELCARWVSIYRCAVFCNLNRI